MAAVVLPLSGLIPASLEQALSARSGPLADLALGLIIVSPTLASVVGLLLTRSDEYRIHRVKASSVRVSGEFARLVRMVDKFTPGEVLDDSLD